MLRGPQEISLVLTVTNTLEGRDPEMLNERRTPAQIGRRED